MRAVLDIEADGLNPTKIWMVVALDIDTNQYYTFFPYREDIQRNYVQELKDFIAKLTLAVGHNVINYDFFHLERLYGVTVPKEIVRDTLVLSKLFQFQLPGGHSLENWGSILKEPKLEFSKFDEYSDEMLTYCKQDVLLNLKVYQFLSNRLKNDSWKRSVQVEHEMQYICLGMHLNGFSFDIDKAKEIYSEIEERCSELDIEIQKAFPPKTKLIKEITPSKTKSGLLHRKDFKWYNDTDFTIFSDGCPFSLFEWETFNPKSPKQLVERLNEAGWKPIDKTKGHALAIKNKEKEKLEHFKIYGWMVNETNLSTLPDDAPKGARCLVERLLLGSRLQTLKTWIDNYNQETKKIHGTFNAIGTWTHRLSHTNPNLGNVSAEKTIKYKSANLRELAIHYGGRMRKLFKADEDSWLVGTDMEGAHLRLFSHFINDQDLIKALVSGDKKLGTDPHTLNKQKLGHICPDRDLAKTFIFTFLNGGGVGKVMEIFKCSRQEAEITLNEFITSYPGLNRWKKEIIPSDAKRGYFVGLDGRKIFQDSEHLMIAGYLQNGEKVVMAHANVLWQKELTKLQIPFKQCNLVHDEFQTNIIGDYSLALKASEVQSEAIKQVGLNLGIVCPLAGESKIGKDWLETH